MGPVDMVEKVTLNGGFWLEDLHYRDAGLRPLTGHDEAYMLSISQRSTLPQWITALLSRCLTHLGPVSPAPPELVRGLTVGDREALLLRLRRLTLGDRLSCVLNCSNRACGERLDVDLAVSSLLVPPYSYSTVWHEASLDIDGMPYCLRFRLPTGADQEAVAELAKFDVEAAADELLRRCVERVSYLGKTLEIWPEDLGQRLSTLLDEYDPQAQLILNLSCPECGEASSVLLDMGQFFAQELSHRMRNLYREVHLLAWYYHWSESEIMGMTFSKRRIYLDLLDEAVSEASRR